VRKTMIKKIVAASVSATLAFAPFASHACTAVNIVAKDGSVVAGRTMEQTYPVNMHLLQLPLES